MFQLLGYPLSHDAKQLDRIFSLQGKTAHNVCSCQEASFMPQKVNENLLLSYHEVMCNPVVIPVPLKCWRSFLVGKQPL